MDALGQFECCYPKFFLNLPFPNITRGVFEAGHDRCLVCSVANKLNLKSLFCFHELIRMVISLFGTMGAIVGHIHPFF
jgi:hypothetical protein